MLVNKNYSTSFKANIRISKSAEIMLKEDFDEINSFRCSKMQEMFGKEPLNFDDEIRGLKDQFKKVTEEIPGTVQINMGKSSLGNDISFSEYTVSYVPPKGSTFGNKKIQSNTKLQSKHNFCIIFP